MSTRLASHGRLINRAKALSFTFNGKVMSGFEGDTLAASLLANDQMLMGRSFKYHRPRGVLASGGEEPKALINLGVESGFHYPQKTIPMFLMPYRKRLAYRYNSLAYHQHSNPIVCLLEGL